MKIVIFSVPEEVSDEKIAEALKKAGMIMNQSLGAVTIQEDELKPSNSSFKSIVKSMFLACAPSTLVSHEAKPFMFAKNFLQNVSSGKEPFTKSNIEFVVKNAGHVPNKIWAQREGMEVIISLCNDISSI